MNRVICVPAVIAFAFTLLVLPSSTCSSEQNEGRADETRSEVVREPSEEARSEPQASLVPIAHLTSNREDVSTEELSQTRELAVPQEFQEAAGDLLDRSDFEGFDSAGEVVDHVSRTPESVGLVPWEEIEPRVKALAVDGEFLLEPGAANPEGYPLRRGAATGPDPEELRRVVVAGDIVLDRGQNYVVIQQNMGLDFPLDGGYAAVTERVPEPSSASEFGVIHQFAAERQGEAGEVREYLEGADLALANFENPVVEDAIWHPDEPTFTGDLRLLPILNQAGIDGVTLANNHILDAGVPGLEETLGHLESADISHAGAGMDLSAAREPMIFDVGGTRVGVLSYQNVPSYEWAWATENFPGTAPLQENVMREDIRRLRPAVDLVVVMPHWGAEYFATPEPGQVELAHAAIDAGADLVVGNHAHWPKGIEMYGGKPIFYGTGNFLFDQSWSEETSTGIFVDVTLYEDRVVQARPVPFIILDKSQPNFLVPEAGGERALNTIFSASLGPEFEAYQGSSPGGSG
jgi:poly-gamma-glutamate capsule biosynthesis protein CapA/YwtB (metallophosphatase superfamily)